MALPLPTTTDVQIVRMVKALFDAAPGNTYLTAFQDDVAENGLTAFANGLAAYVSTDAATLASTVVANLGLTGDSATNGELYLLQEFAANPGNYGQVILNAMNALSGMESDPIFGADAAAYNASVLAAYTYSIDTDNTTTNLVTLMAADDAAAENIGQTFPLTSGIDSVVGTTGNDTINALENSLGAATLTGLDAIDGGAGTDTLNVTDTAAIGDPTTVTVANVEVANLTSAGTIAANVSAWTGLTTVKSVSVGDADFTAAATTDVTATVSAHAANGVSVTGGKDVSVAATGTTTGTVGITNAAGAVAVAVTGNYTDGADTDLGDITVVGGTTVSVTQASGITAAESTAAVTDGTNNKVTQGDVSVTGIATTTAVTVTQAAAVTEVDSTGTDGVIGVTTGAVTIADANAASTTKAATIATVTLNNYGNSTISSNALSTLNLSGTAGTLGITTGLTTPTNTTLALNLNKVSGTNTITDSTAAGGGAGYTAINVTTSGAASTLANIAAVDVTTLSVAGDQKLTLTTAAGLSSLSTVTVSGAASFTSSAATGLGAVKTLTSTSTGTTTVTVDATAVAVTGGAGVEAITYEAAIGATAKIDLGAGNDSLKLFAATTKGATITGGDGTDTLVVADGDFIDGVVTYSSFEVADITSAAAGTLDMDYLASATSIISKGTFGATDITDAVAGTTVSMTSVASTNTTTGAALSYALKDDTGTADSVTVSLNSLDTDTNVAASDDVDGKLTVTSFTADGIETFNISSNASTTDGDLTAGDYVNTITSLAGDAVKTLTLTGAADLTITDLTVDTLTKVDASAMTGQLTISLDASADTVAVAVLGGSAADTITMTSNTAANNIIVGNGGADVITLAAAGTKETVRFAADTDSVLTLTDTTTPAVTPVVYDTATGYDSVTNFTTTEDKIELSSLLGLATGDARTAIAGKGTISDPSADATDMTQAELAAALQTLIGTGVDFFNDGTTDRAVAQVLVDDNVTDDAILFVDVNADGDFTNGTDCAIYLVGATTGLVITDIVFG
jgi:S-layer protein